MRNILKNHLLTILCFTSLIVLALPLAKVVSSVDIGGYSGGSAEVVISGFEALKSSFFAYILILGPILLIAMNYIKPLEPYKGILAIIVPIVSLISLIIVVVTAASSSVSADSQYLTVDVETKIGIGAILAGLSYIGTIVAGAITYHNFALDEFNIKNIKNSGAAILSTAHEKISSTVHSVSQSASETSDYTANPVKESKEPSVKTPVKRNTNLNRVDEILKLIERLSEMQKNGILTEEEYTAKKQQLLEEI